MNKIELLKLINELIDLYQDELTETEFIEIVSEILNVLDIYIDSLIEKITQIVRVYISKEYYTFDSKIELIEKITSMA
jgi:hypothetical protein